MDWVPPVGSKLTDYRFSSSSSSCVMILAGASAPLVLGHTGLDGLNVCAAAGPRGLVALLALDGTAHRLRLFLFCFSNEVQGENERVKSVLPSFSPVKR